MTLTREQIEHARNVLRKAWPGFALDSPVDALCDAALRSLSVPAEGWVAVPLEPTEEMLKCLGSARYNGAFSGDLFYVRRKAVYKAMLDAAPKP